MEDPGNHDSVRSRSCDSCSSSHSRQGSLQRTQGWNTAAQLSHMSLGGANTISMFRAERAFVQIIIPLTDHQQVLNYLEGHWPGNHNYLTISTGDKSNVFLHIYSNYNICLVSLAG